MTVEWNDGARLGAPRGRLISRVHVKVAQNMVPFRIVDAHDAEDLSLVVERQAGVVAGRRLMHPMGKLPGAFGRYGFQASYSVGHENSLRHKGDKNLLGG
jgi:hypothetical protein